MVVFHHWFLRQHPFETDTWWILINLIKIPRILSDRECVNDSVNDNVNDNDKGDNDAHNNDDMIMVSSPYL